MFNTTRINFIHTKSWVKPAGYDTGIKIFNCVAKEKVPLIVKNKGIITWYTCGPTVYDEAHIGHASCYLKIDIIQRIIRKYFNYNLVTAINITDIDDKIIKRSKEENKSVDRISKLYENDFWKDLLELKINKPNIIMRVTENMNCIKDFIGTLMLKELAYVGEDGSVYFKIKNFHNYGKLVNINTSESNDSNENVDCVLWKSSKQNEPMWESSWGNGRPGWHVECSALASKLFGSSLDIHAGGMDLKFPHHENEEAQSCAYHSCSQWVNYWIHVGQLYYHSSEKMSKSLKNTIGIRSLLENYESDSFRIACLMSHYRSRMEYSTDLMKLATKVLKKYRNFISNCEMYSIKTAEVTLDDSSVKFLLLESKEELNEALCDDFNTPEVINILNKILKITNPLLSTNSISVKTALGLRNFVSQIFSLFNIAEVEEKNVVHSGTMDSEVLDTLRRFRENIREIGITTSNNNILKQCDEVRTFLNNKGIGVKDLNKDLQRVR